MRKLLATTIALTGLLLVGDVVPAAQAQRYAKPPINPYVRPPISPYINLARGGSAGINYYGIVRPQLQMDASLQQVQQNQAMEAVDLQMLATGRGLPITGVSTQYMNFSHYYGGRLTNPAVMRPAVSPAATPPGR